MVSRIEEQDPDRVKVYDAQFVLDAQLHFDNETIVVMGQSVYIPVMRKFGELSHIQTYVDWVLASDFVKRRWPKAAATPCHVRKRKSDSAAHWESYYAKTGTPCIAINQAKHGQSWAMQERTVLHELAHHLSKIEHGHKIQSHGPEFRATMLDLFGEFCGPEVKWLQEIAFAEQRLAPAACCL